MPKKVMVPDVGVVEFPDSMDDAQIADTIKKQSAEWGKNVDYAKAGIEARPFYQNKPNIDYKTGAPASVRAPASVKISPSGKMNYLSSVYGNENVATNPYGRAFFRSPESGMWTAFDESGLSLRDVTADWVGPAIDVVPPVAAGFATANPVAVGAAGAGGRALRQATSALLPGSDEMSLLERGADIGMSGLLTGGAQGIANLLSRGADVVRPHNLIAQSGIKSMQTPFAKEGAQLQNIGPLTPGQLTGNRGYLMAEAVARQHPVTADKVFEFEQGQLKSALGKFKRIMNRTSPFESGAISTGDSIRSSFDNTLIKALKVRKYQATKDFGLVEKLSGGKAVIPTANTAATLDDLIKQFGGAPGLDESAKIANKLKSLRSELVPDPIRTVDSAILGVDGRPAAQIVTGGKPVQITAERMQRYLEQLGGAAKGSGKVFSDIDSAQQRMIATRIHQSLMDDLASAGGESGDDIARALFKARANYAKNSEPIEYIEKTALGKVFGTDRAPPPEVIANKIFKMQPSEIRAVLPVIPEAKRDVQRYMLQKMLDESIPAASQQASRGVKFSPAKFNTFLAKHDARFREMFGAKDYGEVQQVAKYLSRLTDRANMQGSQTQPLAMTWDILKSAFTINPGQLARGVGGVLYPKHIANAMTTPQGRQALMTLSTTKPGTKAAIAASAYITGTLAREDDFPISETLSSRLGNQ